MGEINVLTDIEFMAKRIKDATLVAGTESDDPVGVYDLIVGHWYLLRTSHIKGTYWRASEDPESRIVVGRFDRKEGERAWFTLAVGEDERAVGRGQIVAFADLGGEHR
jgi:hypothetical protein